MTILKYKDIHKMSESEREEKLNDLKLELTKNRSAGKGKMKTKEIKKAVARLLTFNSIKKPIDKK